MFFFDPTMLLLIPALILAFYAQAKVRSAYAKYSQIPNSHGLTGAQVAVEILRRNGLMDVQVEEVPGELTDHYDPRTRTVRLSTANYRERSIAAASIAAHEVGHAIQHATAYMPLQLRHAILPATNLGSWMAFPLFIMGLIFSTPFLMDLGIILFTGVVLFHVVTLPVEFNASSRALKQLVNHGLVASEELEGARKVLNAAALTYVAAATMAVMNLLRLLMLKNLSEDY